MRRILLALSLVAAVVGCDRPSTAPRHATPATPTATPTADIVCRSGYVVTSGNKCPDSTQQMGVHQAP